MLRAATLRSSSAFRIASLPKPVVSSFSRHTVLRMNSSVADKASAALKAAQEKKNELQRDWDAPILTYEDVKPRTLAPNTDAYLIDVREPDEVIQGSIPSSVNIPLSTLSGDLHLSPKAFKEKFGFEKPRSEQELVFYCRSGKRSASASDIAKRNGYQKIYNYAGSWLEWSSKETK